MTAVQHLSGARIFPAGPRIGCYFPSESAERVRTALVRCTERMDGPALLIGPSGSGKSLMLAVLAEHFRGQLSIANLPAGVLRSPRELHQGILYALELPFRGLDEGELKLSLLERLEGGEASEGVLLLVDEAQSLSLDTMEELRMLTNVVRDGLSRVRLVLAGTPDLEEQLADARLVSFDQRIAVRCYLRELSRAETRSYVQAHLSTAGQQVDLFTPEALEEIYEASEGLPRHVNQICDHAILLARAEGHAEIDAGLVQEAWTDLQQLPSGARPTPADPDDDMPEDVIEFGVWGDSTEPEEADLDCDPSELLSGDRPNEPADQFRREFSVVHEEPGDRIDAIQQQLASIRTDAPAAERGGLGARSASEMDYSLPDDEWPEVEVVVRDASAVKLDGHFEEFREEFAEELSTEFSEEEVLADPFAAYAAPVLETWSTNWEVPSREAERGPADAGGAPPRDVAPLQSVPLMVHVQTELYSPDPVLPEEAAPEPALAIPTSVAFEEAQEKPRPSESPLAVPEDHRADPGVHQPPAAKVRPGLERPFGRPAKKRFATLFTSLQK